MRKWTCIRCVGVLCVCVAKQSFVCVHVCVCPCVHGGMGVGGFDACVSACVCVCMHVREY